MSFISSYLEHTANTEPPLQYHQWSCLSTLSVLAGRRFWFKLGPYTYYPNLYVLLVGHPGVKKSSALDRAKDILREVKCCPIAATQATKEFIAKAMSHEKFPGKHFFKYEGRMEEYNQYAILATEFTQFIGVDEIGMLDFLTSIYTEKVYDRDTKNQGRDYFIGPYITILACLTPQLLKGFIKMNILTSGFARRTVFVYGVGGQIIPFPDYTDAQKAACARCIEYGHAMQGYSGEFFMAESGRKWYESWYRNLQTNITEISTPSTEGYYKTKHEILFKVAMLTALSEDLINRELTDKHFEFVENRFLVPNEKNLERVFEGAGINPNAQAVSQICRMLEAIDRPMAEKHVLAMFYDNVTSLSDLRDAMDHLVNVGRLARKDAIANNVVLGRVIGTPGALARATLSEIVSVLERPLTLPPATDLLNQ